MPGPLQADADGLRLGGADSATVAAALTVGTEAAGVGQPSSSGVEAFDAALASARSLQSGRMGQQAGSMSDAGHRYERTDGRSADSVAGSM